MKETNPVGNEAVSMTEFFLSWKDVLTKPSIIDFIAAVVEESSSAVYRWCSESPSPCSAPPYPAWH